MLRFRRSPAPLTAIIAAVLVTATGLLFSDEPKGPEQWEKDMKAFEAREAKSPSPGNALLFVGSSSIRKWDLSVSWPDEMTINNGFGGSTLADSIHHFDRLILPYRPRAIIIYAGDNDMKKGLSAEGVAKAVKTLFDQIAKTKPGVPVIYIAIKPSIARWSLWPEMKAANAAVAALCAADEKRYFANVAKIMLPEDGAPPPADWFAKDGLHLSPSGYARWTAVVNEQLKEAGVLK